MRVLITGSHGFVGRNFVRHLMREGHEILGVDSLLKGSGAQELSRWKDSLPVTGKFEEMITDVRSWFTRNPVEHFDLVIHLAAVVGGRATIEGNPLAVAEDLAIDSDFWRWTVSSRPGHVVSFSSSAAYPVDLQSNEVGDRLLKESDLDLSSLRGSPDMTYGWAKMTSEYMGLVVAEKYGLKVATYRPFSGYGSDQDSSYPFRAICERAAQKQVDDLGRFFVWGSGLQKRDFIHIEDVVECVVSTYPKINDGSAMNISSGQLTSFIDLARMACETAGWSPEVIGLSDKPEGVFSRGGDTTLQKSFGFSPQISLSDGVERCLHDIKKKG